MKKFFSLFLLAAFGLGADVLTVMTGTAGNAGSTAAELANYIDLMMLDVAELNCILPQFGQKRPLPQRSGAKTIQFNRMEKLTVSTSPTQLTEGISPDAVGLTINQYTATLEQYGQLVRISDLSELTAKHPLVQEAIQRLSTWATETYDVLVYGILDAASNVYYANNRAGATTLLASDVPSYNDLVELNAILFGQGAKPFADGNYACVTSGQPYAALQRDPDYKAANQLAGAEKIWRGQIGAIGGMSVVRSNAPGFVATSQATSGFTNKIYSSFVMGMNSFQISDFQSIESVVTPPGGHGDPLKQSTKLGVKFSMKSVISNQNWIRRFRSSGNDSATN
jgi:N4-gp56 family major capsid protein